MLIRVAQRATGPHLRSRLVAASPAVRRPLEATGPYRSFDVHTERADALASD